MKTVCALLALFVGAHSFVSSPTSRIATELHGNVPKDQMTDDQLKVLEIQETWSEIRHLDREEAQNKLEGEWLEAYNRFYQKYDEDMVKMEEIAQKLQKFIEPPKIQKKTKGQKKRDKWAKVQAREAARAGAK